MLFDEFDDAGESEASLSALGAVVGEPSPVGVPADGCGADAEEARSFFESQFWIEQSSNQVFSGFFEVTLIVFAGDGVGEECAKEFDIFGKVFENELEVIVENGVRFFDLG